MNINKKIKTLEFKLSKLLNWWLFWAYKSKFHWNWMEFAEHREYNYWDSVKNIDWKTSSKSEQIYIKNYEEERDLNVLFILDDTLSMNFWSQINTKKDILTEVFYCLAMSAYNSNDNIWWVIFDDKWYDYIDYKKSKWNIYWFIDQLYSENNKKLSFESSNIWKIDKVLKTLNKRNIRNNLIFILTDDTNIVNYQNLKILWLDNEIILLNIFDVIENNLSLIKWVSSFINWNKFLNIDLSNKSSVDNYNKLRLKNLRSFSEKLRKNNIWYLKLDTNSDIFSELVWYFYKVKR